MRDERGADPAGIQRELDPLVNEALTRLTHTLQRHRAISDDFENDLIVGTLLVLHDAGAPLHEALMRAWAAAHQWSDRSTTRMAGCVRDITAGNRPPAAPVLPRGYLHQLRRRVAAKHKYGRDARAYPQAGSAPRAMDAEFDTVAGWTAQVMAEYDPADRIPPSCRGSGGPGALRWFLQHQRPQHGQPFLDCGAGMGGPAAFAARESGVRPVLTDPQQRACDAARLLFGLPALRAGIPLPIATGVIPSGWSLGVLCTVENQPAFLSEIRRVLHPAALFGLLVYTAAPHGGPRLPQPEGNSFPTAHDLQSLLERASLQVVRRQWLDDVAAPSPDWAATTTAVQTELQRRHSNDPRWVSAHEQSQRMGALLDAGQVRGQLLVVSPT